MACPHKESDQLYPLVCIPCLPDPGWIVVVLAVAYASFHFVPWALAGFPVVGR